VVTTCTIEKTNFGFTLSNSIEKFVLNESKSTKSIAPFYLKKVAPEPVFISGMFYNKYTKYYYGKTANNEKVRVTISTVATISII
jgi:hypothetical protein